MVLVMLNISEMRKKTNPRKHDNPSFFTWTFVDSKVRLAFDESKTVTFSGFASNGLETDTLFCEITHLLSFSKNYVHRLFSEANTGT